MDSAEHQVERIRKCLDRYKEWAQRIDAEQLPLDDDVMFASYKQTSFILKLVVRELETELT